MEWISEFFWTVGPLIIIMVILPLGIVFLLRWLGAWMFRINEMIQLQKDILQELKNLNAKE